MLSHNIIIQKLELTQLNSYLSQARRREMTGRKPTKRFTCMGEELKLPSYVSMGIGIWSNSGRTTNLYIENSGLPYGGPTFKDPCHYWSLLEIISGKVLFLL
ncbi:hypothetical protein AVEN_242555-1 [Araneus ventricosus]|uniref:Uncharacterized protein n=1 Tax=Araneus ventricosus TaxID=182803 RepID=A0A4Y2M164_ARAVE|nr:hypothetical protein AVEN_242555-1 [Araneus ventricosus]